jgi:cytoskeletal protein CcmA (bactofilin family)
MWKRDEAVRPPQPTSGSPISSVAEASAPRAEGTGQQERDMVNIGKSVVIKGELSGSEDLTIEGQVEGKIELKQNILTIGPNGRIKAEIFAKSIVVQGEVHGNITASERADIRDNGSVDGDLSSPRIAIADGAHFRGSIDMQRAAGGGKPIVEHGKPGDTGKPGEAGKHGDARPATEVKPPVTSVTPAPQPATTVQPPGR